MNIHFDLPHLRLVLILNRDDGKDALKFYTNPKYFFELWCQEMQKNITDIRERKRGKKVCSFVKMRSFIHQVCNLLIYFNRDDGKDAMKFYTNPKYFFELWFEEMQKNITDIRERRRGRRVSYLCAVAVSLTRLVCVVLMPICSVPSDAAIVEKALIVEKLSRYLRELTQ